MNKYHVTEKAWEATKAILFCIICALSVWAMSGDKSVFTPQQSVPVTGSPSVQAAHLSFSSPSSEARFCYVRESGFFDDPNMPGRETVPEVK